MRLHPKDRKEQILEAAIKVASSPGGWTKLTREAVASEAKCANSLVSQYFGTMVNLRRAIMRYAVTKEYLSVIAQGIASGDKYAKKADANLKARAIATL